ncbi:hypothetical protein BQ8482_111560 [Mesorhizobium delmotii]|uniref:Uncharacterized protein n=1 Tax=Mesorhizobium delmotii TaxID=1631247 RepID=A0A2P9AES9_9HYPH|nr:hypothetical protein BQ8482_111560 [Mesorhizobium delmotii]
MVADVHLRSRRAVPEVTQSCARGHVKAVPEVTQKLCPRSRKYDNSDAMKSLRSHERTLKSPPCKA